ncbi:MAG: ketoacyl-ACP synthase III [Chlamydiae bacterium]|nr:ketoacyl-ACP synthase III [Chlamydiota bacterium]MBI3278143.1 ketoacyl-ACP synthase III [Chlamydiota bacterium]
MVGIVGTGCYLPKKILSNFDLEKTIETTDQWIFERTGIRERRISSHDFYASDMGAHAAKKALQDSKINPSEVDLLIVATMSADMLCPSTACIIQEKIGASKAFAFDLNAACSGFLFALEVAKKFLESDQYQTALVIGVEKLSSMVDWKDRGTCILFGDGAGAAVLKKNHADHQILGAVLGSDGRGADLLKVPAGGSMMPATHETIDQRLHFIKMDGREVYKNAIDLMYRMADETLLKCGLKREDVDLFIPHQANKRIIDAVAKKLSLPSEKIYINVDRYGNTSAASIIIALDDARKEGRMQSGDCLLIVVFGAGFTWGGMVIRW